MRRTVYILICLAFALPARAEVWSFETPPSAIHRYQVDADWRHYKGLALDVRLMGEPGESAIPIQCSFFIETKQDWWFQGKTALILNADQPQSFSLDLRELSPDWEAHGCLRPWGVDAARWVRNWGVKVFSPVPVAGRLLVGPLRLVERRQPSPLAIESIRTPETLAAGAKAPVMFRLNGLLANPFRQSEAKVYLKWIVGEESRAAPAFYRQDYYAVEPPYSGQSELQALGLPEWRVNWAAPGPGKYRLSLVAEVGEERFEKDLGERQVVDVPPPAGAAKPAADTPTDSARFVQQRPAQRCFRYQDGDWVGAGEIVGDRFWQAPLDWTTRWGHYTGIGELDQKIAFKLERALAVPSNAQRPAPILIFSESELENSAIYNWVDHPMNTANGGMLERPAGLFNNAEASEVILDRARYLWARYGNSPKVAGFAVLLQRPGSRETAWLNRVAQALAAEFPDVPLYSNNLVLPAWDWERQLDLYDAWTTDARLSRRTELRRLGDAIEVRGAYPGSTAIVARFNKHWAGAKAFGCDITTPPDAGDEVKVMCFIRTSRDQLFESPLVWLRGGETNRVMFWLDDPGQWRNPADSSLELHPYQLLNVKEIGLRFFSDDAKTLALRLAKQATLYGPYRIDQESRDALAINEFEVLTPKPTQYGRYELDFQLNRVFANPYDPEEIDVSLQVKQPDGTVVQHPGFYFQPVKLTEEQRVEAARLEGRPSWRVRYTPTQTGKYQWALIAKADGEEAQRHGVFTTKASGSPGFVRISPRDSRYFEFSDGSFYYPIGHNLRSPSDRRPTFYTPAVWRKTLDAEKEGIFAYQRWFKTMQANGENFSRIWLCPWWGGLEWNSKYPGYHGVGYYNQENAARIDMLLELAEQHGVYLNVATMNHGALSTRIDGDWEENPLCESQPGGFVRYASDFFTNERALESHRRKIRYTIARWGYSTAVAIWGVITESEWVEAYDRGLYVSKPPTGEFAPDPYRSPRYQQRLRQWLLSMSRFIKTTDAHPHLVSTHFSNPQHGTEMWWADELDVIHNNAYTFFANPGLHWQTHFFRRSNGVADVVHVFGRFFEQYGAKPVLIGEWGGHPVKNTEIHLKQELHTGLWAAAMTNCAGVTGWWWWNLLDAENMYPHFKAVAAFTKGEERRGRRLRSTEAPVWKDPRRRDPGLESGAAVDDRDNRSALLLANHAALSAYVYNRAINRHNNSRFASGFDDPAFPLSGRLYLEAPARLRPGRYEVEYWNTYTGKPISKTAISITEQNRTVPLIPHRVDLALKMKQVR